MEALSPDVHREVEFFLFHEARLLDNGRLMDWLDLLTDDVRYVMPVRQHRQPRAGAISGALEQGSFALFDDDKSSLTMRVQRLETGHAHAEAPVSVTQRLITNIMVERGETEMTFHASSNFLIHQERRGRFSATFIGRRHDHLRRAGGSLKIAYRYIELAQTILPATISILF